MMLPYLSALVQHNSASVARPQRTLSIQIQVSNTKTAIVYASVFAAVLSRNDRSWRKVVVRENTEVSQVPRRTLISQPMLVK